ncbi:MAG: hypothetical protein IJO29_02400 [Oscillospiraceae bacterium]|nr:hypothetical protein [Oscillospiraceae bacterium]
MKKYIVAIVISSLITLFSGCSNTIDTPEQKNDTVNPTDQNNDIIESYSTVIDSSSLDIDGDGILEDCTMTYGPTSGIFTIVITASANGEVKYKNTFNINYGNNLKFDDKDGVPQIFMEKYDYDSRETYSEYHKLYVEGKRIVIDGLDSEYEGYWGDAEWNYDLK